MKITKDRTVGELRMEFNTLFPYLKLEFYNIPYKSLELLPKERIIRHGAALFECCKNINEGTIELKPELTVAELERQFWEKFGLSVQVFRKSGPLWIETSLTDSWTLRQQNYEGEQMSTTQPEQSPSMEMYDRDQVE